MATAIALPVFKVVVIGGAGVGKSSLILRLVYNTFGGTTATVGVDFIEHVVTLDDDKSRIRMQLWDTAGHERFNTSLSSAYMRNASAVLYVYDADSPRSIDTLTTWVRECEREHGRAPVRFVIGTKCDLAGTERTDTLGIEFTHTIGADRHCRCSAATGDGVVDTFEVLADRLRYVAVDQALRAEEHRRNNPDIAVSISQAIRPWVYRC